MPVEELRAAIGPGRPDQRRHGVDDVFETPLTCHETLLGTFTLPDDVEGCLLVSMMPLRVRADLVSSVGARASPSIRPWYRVPGRRRPRPPAGLQPPGSRRRCRPIRSSDRLDAT